VTAADVLDWTGPYRDRIRTAAQAVSTLSNGQRIFIGSGGAEPQELVAALAESSIFDCEVVHIMTLGTAPYVADRFREKFRHNAFFIGSNVREAVARCRADYTPIFLSEIPRLFRSGKVDLDVALIQVSLPDRHGYFSLGVSVDVVKAAVESARRVIAEVNPNMPWTSGDSLVTAADLDLLVPVATPILEHAPHPADEVARRIGKHIASLIPDGATLQMGIGSIPDAVLQFLGEKRDLGIHTEMFSDGLMPLIQSGVVNGRRKTLHPGRAVASFAMGTRRLYDFIDHHPFFQFHPVDYVNDPFVISQNDRMVSINSALEVDLTGQVCSDSLGYNPYSGIGGQVDFIRGAARSRGGKPILALPSTARGGSVSRIVPHLREGAGVVTSRGDVHFVVTEYGVADLYGRSLRERALSLMEIAHPKFRPWLLAEAKSHQYVPEDQKEIEVGAPPYPEEMETPFACPGGQEVRFRPVRPSDEPLMRELFYRLSPESVTHRFFAPLKSMGHQRLQDFVVIDYQRDMAIVGVVPHGETEEIIAVGRYSLDPARESAEIAFLVGDGWQKRGIGSFLFEHLIRIGRSRGIRRFTAEVMADNHAMLKVFHKSRVPVQSVREGGVYHLSFQLSSKDEPGAPAPSGPAGSTAAAAAPEDGPDGQDPFKAVEGLRRPAPPRSPPG
jgi:acyl-CoA hydrolase/RimJ/RimL family protein N-acetyltransferase